MVQAADPTPTELNDRIDALDQQVKILNRKLELANEAAAAKGTAAAGDGSVRPVANEKDGFGIVSADGNTKIKFWGYIQGDGRFFFDDDKTRLTDQFLLRRARAVMEGTVAKYWDFRIMPEFGNTGGTAPAVVSLTDAYVIGNFDPSFKVEVGRFKVPVGIEFLQNDTVTLFIERGYTTNLVPARDEGVQLFGDLFGGRLSYNLGIFNGGVDNANRDNDNADDKDGVARIMLAPFKGGPAPVANLVVGVAGSFGYADGAAGAGTGLPTGYITAGQNAYATYITPAAPGVSAVANGRHTHLAPQAYWSWGPAEVLAEYAVSTNHIGLGAASDTVSNRAWLVEGGYILTGESASYKGWAPNTAFAPDFSGWGGFQVVGRIERTTLDSRAIPFLTPGTSQRQATGIGAGINWLFNRNVKLALNYEHTTFDSGIAANGDREAENMIESRLQLVF
jgi:phosphate-selective porin OprO/OprP